MRRPGADESAITTACRQFLAGRAIEVAGLSRTSTSGCFRVRLDGGRSVIVKLYVGTAGWKATKERSIVEALADSAKFRTAAVLGGGRLDEHDASALITADLGDHSLWRAVDEGEHSRWEALELIGQMLAALHQIDPTVIRVDDDKPPLPEANLAVRVQHLRALLRRDPSDGIARRVEPALQKVAGLSRRSRSEVGCHGDLHPANIVMRRTEDGALTPHLIDFEAAVRCAPEYDLAKSMVTSSALGNDERRSILGGYGNWHLISDELLHALIVFHVVDGWVYAAHLERRDRALWRGRVDEMLAHYAPLF